MIEKEWRTLLTERMADMMKEIEMEQRAKEVREELAQTKIALINERISRLETICYDIDKEIDNIEKVIEVLNATVTAIDNDIENREGKPIGKRGND